MRAALALTLILATGARLSAAAAVDDTSRYERWCARCHGAHGDGRGPAAVALAFDGQRPRDFTTGRFKIASVASGKAPTDEDLAHTIAEGLPGTPMPYFHDLLTPEEIRGLVTVVRGFGPPQAIGTPLDLGTPVPDSPESRARGAALYHDLGCVACHGAHGRGDGASAAALRGSDGSSIRPADLARPWTFKGGPAASDVAMRLATGLGGTPMPGYLDAASPADLWDVANFVASLAIAPSLDAAAAALAHRPPGDGADGACARRVRRQVRDVLPVSRPDESRRLVRRGKLRRRRHAGDDRPRRHGVHAQPHTRPRHGARGLERRRSTPRPARRSQSRRPRAQSARHALDRPRRPGRRRHRCRARLPAVASAGPEPRAGARGAGAVGWCGRQDGGAARGRSGARRLPSVERRPHARGRRASRPGAQSAARRGRRSRQPGRAGDVSARETPAQRDRDGRRLRAARRRSARLHLAPAALAPRGAGEGRAAIRAREHAPRPASGAPPARSAGRRRRRRRCAGRARPVHRDHRHVSALPHRRTRIPSDSGRRSRRWAAACASRGGCSARRTRAT